MLIIRNAEVDFFWSSRCTSEEFDKECCEYDKAPIKDAEYKIPNFEFQSLYISTLSRSRNTAKRLFAEDNLKETELINEVPQKWSFDTGKKMATWF